MNLTIDTKKKTILLNEEILVGDLLDGLEDMGILYNEYKLILSTKLVNNIPWYYGQSTLISPPVIPNPYTTSGRDVTPL